MPELSDHFISKAKNLLADRNHGVLLTAITLVVEMVQVDPACLEEFRNVSQPQPILSDPNSDFHYRPYLFSSDTSKLS